MADAAEVVQRCYEAALAGDFDTARRCWADDAVWHGPVNAASHLAGDKTVDEYFEQLLVPRFTQYPEYRADVLGHFVVGTDIVVLHIRTHNGEAPDPLEGIMLWQVVDGRISECWAISGNHRDEYGF